MTRSHLKYRLIGLAVATLAFACADSMAGSPTIDPQKFAVQRTTIEQELQEGGRYAEIDSSSRKQVLAALKRISSVFARNGDAANLSADDEVLVFNDQELINSLLTRAAKDSRVVCERVARRSSHISDTSCATIAERRRQADGAEETVRIIQSKGSPNAVSGN